MTRLRDLARGVASLVALAAILTGIPAVLFRFGHGPNLGNPTGGWWERLSDTVVSDSTVFAVLTVAAGVVWALFAVSVVVEFAAGLRGRQAPRLALAGLLQRPARALVVSLLMTLSVNRTTAFAGPASASLGPVARGPVAAVVLSDAEPAPASPSVALLGRETGPGPVTPTVAPAATDQGKRAPEVVVVERGDSAWQLAAMHLGDGMRWRELWDLNNGVVQSDGRAWTDPQLIRPGWHLELPRSQPDTPVAGTGPATGGREHVVVPGDTLSGIARQYLGDPARYGELFEVNRDRPQPDGRQLTDPDLIRPGWHIDIPAPASMAPDPVAPPEAATATDLAPTPLPPDSVTTSPPQAPPPLTSAPRPDPSTPTTSAAPVGPTSPTAGDPSTSSDDAPQAGRAPLLAGISGAVVIATGVALRAVRLRRRRHLRGARYTQVAATPTEAAVLAAADVPLVRWAGQTLAGLVEQLDRRRITAAPLAVELSADTGVEVLWDQPQAAPVPPGWTSADGGWAWRYRFDPDAAVPTDELAAAIPALVTIGRRDGRQLLVDLEAFGALTVTGPDEQVDSFLRSIVIELATGNDLADAYLSTVGIDGGLEGHSDRGTAVAVDNAIAAANGTCRAIRDDLDRAGLGDTFRARVGDATPLEATVVVARDLDPDRIAELVAAARPRSGVGVVVECAETDVANAWVVLDSVGMGRLEPLGITFDAAGLPQATADRLEETLTALTDLPVDGSLEDAPTTHDQTFGAPPPQPNGHREFLADPVVSPGINGNGAAGAGSGPRDQLPFLDRAQEPATEEPDRPGEDRPLFDPDPDPTSAPHGVRMEVRVLGVPSVPDRPDIGRRELILAVLLACRGGSLAATAVQDALWGGRPVESKTVWNFVASTRRALGAFPDGSPVMPSADRSRGRLRLDPRVTTDLAALTDRLEQSRSASSSEAIELLRDGLALIEGPPFDAAGFDWAHRDQDVARASMVIEQAAEALVGLALEAGLTDVAREAVTRGLRGLPGDEQLYRARMRVEHHAGQHTAVAAAYDELTVYLGDFDLEPSPATTALFHELVRRQRA